jgi:Na+-translocating ferredoxin:NAD+ oxidoreductase RnfA subunit
MILSAMLFGLLGLAPLALIASKNLAAVPVGLFAWGAFIVASPLAWIVYLQSSKKVWLAAFALFVVLAALTIFTSRFAGAETSTRLLWSIGSFFSWAIAIYAVPGAIRVVFRRKRRARPAAVAGRQAPGGNTPG